MLFSMISVPCGHGLYTLTRMMGTDNIMLAVGKYIMRRSRISYRHRRYIIFLLLPPFRGFFVFMKISLKIHTYSLTKFAFWFTI